MISTELTAEVSTVTLTIPPVNFGYSRVKVEKGTLDDNTTVAEVQISNVGKLPITIDKMEAELANDFSFETSDNITIDPNETENIKVFFTPQSNTADITSDINLTIKGNSQTISDVLIGSGTLPTFEYELDCNDDEDGITIGEPKEVFLTINSTNENDTPDLTSITINSPEYAFDKSGTKILNPAGMFNNNTLTIPVFFTAVTEQGTQLNFTMNGDFAEGDNQGDSSPHVDLTVDENVAVLECAGLTPLGTQNVPFGIIHTCTQTSINIQKPTLEDINIEEITFSDHGDVYSTNLELKSYQTNNFNFDIFFEPKEVRNYNNVILTIKFHNNLTNGDGELTYNLNGIGEKLDFEVQVQDDNNNWTEIDNFIADPYSDNTKMKFVVNIPNLNNSSINNQAFKDDAGITHLSLKLSKESELITWITDGSGDLQFTDLLDTDPNFNWTKIDNSDPNNIIIEGSGNLGVNSTVELFILESKSFVGQKYIDKLTIELTDTDCFTPQDLLDINLANWCLSILYLNKGGVELEPVAPNPISGSFKVNFLLPFDEHIKIDIVDKLGNVVKSVEDSMLKPGQHEREVDASNMSSGIYYLRFQYYTVQQVQILNVIK